MEILIFDFGENGYKNLQISTWHVIFLAYELQYPQRQSDRHCIATNRTLFYFLVYF